MCSKGLWLDSDENGDHWTPITNDGQWLGKASDPTPSPITHPPHYGGEDDPYEAIKVIEAWKLGFHLGNLLKYVNRAGKKGDALEDLKKAQWYLNREISNLEKKA
jgi:hypothetical protein